MIEIDDYKRLMVLTNSQHPDTLLETVSFQPPCKKKINEHLLNNE